MRLVLRSEGNPIRYNTKEIDMFRTCEKTRIVGPAHDRTELGCDRSYGHRGIHEQRDAYGRGSHVTLLWNSHEVIPVDTTPAYEDPERTQLWHPNYGTVYLRSEFASTFQTNGGQPTRFGVFETAIYGVITTLPLSEVKVVSTSAWGLPIPHGPRTW